MEIQHLDAEGLAFIEKEEGCRLSAYLDSVQVPTIGFGMTYYPTTGKKVTMQDPPITQQQANDMFALMVRPFEQAVYSTTRDDINQHQFNALVSICYNIGTGAFKGSTLLRLVNANPEDPNIRTAFQSWSRAGSNKTALLGRRNREADMYFKTT